MKISISEAKANLSKFIQLLINGKEEMIIISKNGKPVAQLTPIQMKNSKRIGTAKKEMAGFDIDLSTFNSTPIENFGI